MNIFQMKTRPHGIERFNQFIDEKFVCIGWPGIDDLEHASKDVIRDRLEKKYHLNGHRLGNALGSINAFVNTMTVGDIVIIAQGDLSYIGTVGEYKYEKQYDTEQDAICHRRHVEWVNRIKSSDLDYSLQKLINNRNIISRCPDFIEEASIEKLLSPKTSTRNKENSAKLDRLFQDALKILEEEMKSEDPDRRLKAATELLRVRNT